LAERNRSRNARISRFARRKSAGVGTARKLYALRLELCTLRSRLAEAGGYGRGAPRDNIRMLCRFADNGVTRDQLEKFLLPVRGRVAARSMARQFGLAVWQRR
jgi:hypothetical protein